MLAPFLQTSQVVVKNPILRRAAKKDESHAQSPEARPSDKSPGVLTRYAASIVLTAVALAATFAMLPVLRYSVFIFCVGAVAVSAWFGGKGPGILSSIFAVLAVDYFFIPPVGVLVPASPADLIPAFIFIAVSVGISSLTDSLRRERVRAVRAAAESGRSAALARQAANDLKLQSEQMEAFAADLDALHRMGGILASELDAKTINPTAVRTATELTGAEYGAFSTEFKERKTIRSDDLLADPRFGDTSPFDRIAPGDTPVRSGLAVPVVSRTGDVLGSLVLGHSRTAAFTERHERIAMSIASWASVAKDNARLYAAERAARSEAEAANKAKSAFLATMSHELRTPLNAIGGYADLLEVGVHGELTEMQHRDVTRIKRSQRHLLSLINDILNFAKIEAGRVSYAVRPMIIADHLPELESLIAPQLKEKELEFEFRCRDPACAAYADPEKVQQIVLNLLSNAVKFTDRGGRIVLKCRADDEFVMIMVQDNGSGIAKSRLNMIFDPFIQLDRGTTSQHEGTGLGLSISRDLARAMGGDLIAESEVGEGSTFTLSLPLRPKTRPASTVAQRAQP